MTAVWSSPGLPRWDGDRLRTWVYSLLILAFVLVKAAQLPLFAPVVSILTLLAILVSLPACGWMARILTAIFMVAGSSLMWRSGASAAGFVGAFGEMVHLVALFSIVPILAVPVMLGGYSHAISAVLQGRVKSVPQLNALVTILAYICGSFMTMAAVPIMLTSISQVVHAYPIRDKVRFMAVSTTFGHLLPMLWSPVSGIVGAILYSLRVDWFAIFPAMLALSLASLVANWLIFEFLESRCRQPMPGTHDEAGPEDKAVALAAAVSVGAPVAVAVDVDVAEMGIESKPGAQSTARPLLVQMCLAILVLVVVIVSLEQWLRWGLVMAVILTTIPFAWAWSALRGQGRPFVREASRQTAFRLPRMADQFAIFLSTGFFATALHLSGSDHSVNMVFLDLRDLVGTQGLLVLMPLVAVLASCLGLHPLATITLLAEALKPDVLGVDAARLAITLIGSALLTYMVGPFSGTLGLVKSLNNVPTLRLGWWNLPYAGIYYGLLAVTILLL